VPSFDGTDGGPDEHGTGIHAGHGETSMIMHLRPELVDASKFEATVPAHIGDFRHIGFNGKPVTFGWLSNDFGPTGVLGDPTGANAAHGAELFEDSVSFVVEALEEISRFDYTA
jgi:creatinine amidohydrolase